MKYVHKILKWVGSLWFAVGLFAVLSGVLGLTTFIESAYGAAVVQYFVYNSRWFHFLLFLLAVNVLCSMLQRFPWKLRHIPFLIVHAGIIVLLLGCYITATGNREANLAVIEGKSSRYAVEKNYVFTLTPVSLDAKMEANPEFPGSAQFESNEEKRFAQTIIDERNNTTVIPFDPGPFDWSLYKRANWFADERPYKYSLQSMMNLVGHPQGVLFDSDKAKDSALNSGVKIEVLDYLANSQKKPGGPLELSVRWGTREKQRTQMYITPQIGSYRGSMLELGIGASKIFEKGETITFAIAESSAQSAAFYDCDPGKIESGLGTVILNFAGNKFVVPVDDVLKKQSQTGSEMDEARNSMGMLMRNRVMLRSDIQRKETESTDPLEIEKLKSDLVKIDTDIRTQSDKITEIQRKSFYPVENSPFAVGVTQFNPDGLQIDPTGGMSARTDPETVRQGTGPMLHLTLVSNKGNVADQLILFAGRPDLNSHSKLFGVYGTFCLDAVLSGTKAVGVIPPMVLGQAEKPRLDILQKIDGELVCRYWDGQKFTAFAKLAENAMTGIGDKEVEISELKFTPHDEPGYNIESVPYDKNYKYVPQQRAKIRATVDGITDEFWIRSQILQQNPFMDTAEDDQTRYLSGNGRTIKMNYRSGELDLGFALYLRKFTQKMEPGTRIASQYSSLVDMRSPEEIADRIDFVRPRESHPMTPQIETEIKPIDAIEENVLIKMNQPGLFTDQLTGRKYRVYQSDRSGPYGPGTEMFQYLYDKRILPGESQPRESIYKSVLSVNYDPGRGLKYLGCTLLVFGTVWVFYGRKRGAR